MKKLMKRWLAMMLAVLMVVGTLPTSALAARVDETQETPVLEQGDGVADTLERDTGEKPENPENPDETDPAENSWYSTGATATVEPDGTWSITVSVAEYTVGAATNDWAIAFVPKGVTGTGDVIPIEDLTFDRTNGDAQKPGDLGSDIASATGLIAGTHFFVMNGESIGISGDTLVLNQANTGLSISKSQSELLAELKTLKPGITDIDFRVIVLLKGSSDDAQGNTHFTVTETKYKKSGLNDETYVLNLAGPTLSRVTAAGLEAVTGGGYDGENHYLDLPILNESATDVYATGVAGGNAEPITFDSPGDKVTWPGASNVTVKKGDTPAVMNLSYNAAAGETVVVTVPYYDQDIDSVAAGTPPTGTATITVMVISNTIPTKAEPILFEITSGVDFGTIEKKVTVTFPPINTITTDPESGTVETVSDITRLEVDYPMYVDDETPGVAIFNTPGTYNLLAAGDVVEEDDGAGGMIPLIVVSGEGASLKMQLIYKEGTTPTAPGDHPTTIRISPIIDSTYFSETWVDIPVTIRVKAGTPDPVYHEITYNWNGKEPTNSGVDIPAADSVLEGEDYTAVDTSLVNNTIYTTADKLGWTLLGWNTDSTATSGLTTISNVAKDETLYAIWTPKLLSVTFNTAGGTPSTIAADTVQYGSASYQVTVNDPTRDNYTFSGWTASGGATGSGVKKGGSVNGLTSTDGVIKTNVTLTAGWTQDTFSVQYHWNGTPATGAALPSPNPATGIAVSATDNYTLTQPTAVNGWAWDGWKLGEADGVGAGDVITEVSQNQTKNTTVHVWGTWTQLFTVSYNNSGHGNAPSSHTNVRNGSTVTIKDIAAGEDGWTFGGWAASADDAAAGKKKYDAADTSDAITADTELFAIWTRKLSKIKFVYDNGTDADVTYEGGTGDALADSTNPTGGAFPASAGTKANHRFDKWKGSDNATYSSTNPPTFPATEGATLTITAQWVELVTVSYDANYKGTESVTDPASETVDKGDQVTLPTLSATDYKFLGWATTNNAATAGAGKGGEKYTANASIKLYGVWAENPGSAEITVNKDGEAYSDRTVKLKPATGDNISSTSASGGVYTFTDVTAATYTIVVNGVEAGTITVPKGGEGTATVDFYTAEVTGVHGSATVSTTATDKAIGDATATATSGNTESIIVLKDSPVKWVFGTNDTHYHAEQWDSTGETDDISLNKITEKTSHTANYAANEYTVTFNPYEGSTTAASVTVTYPNKVTALPTASYTGYTFTAGEWYTGDGKTSGNWGTKFTTDTAVTADITVYAKYTYTITYDLNASAVTVGSITSTKPADQSGYYSDGGKTAAAAATAQYFQFTGWNTKADGSGDNVAAGETAVTGNKTLYAQWERKTGTLTVNLTKNGTTTVAFPAGQTSLTVKVEGQDDWTTASDATHNWTGLPQGATYAVSLTADGKTFSETSAIVGDDGAVVNIEFDELTVKVDDTDAPSTALVGTGGSANPDVTAASVGPKGYLKGATVYINADAKDGSWDFVNWKNGDNEVSKNAATSVTVNAQTTLTAHFTKPRYVTYLKLTLNGADVDELDATDITAVTLGTGENAKTATPTGSDGIWKVTDVASATEGSYQWNVTSTIGGPFTKAQGTQDDSSKPAVIALYSVKVVNGDGNDATHKPTVDGKERVIMTANSSKTLAANPVNTGYTCTDWVNNAGDDLPDHASTTTTAVTLDKDYQGTAELVLKPVYTFTTTVQTKFGDDIQAPGGSVVLKASGGTGTDVTLASFDGEEAVADLVPGTTYTIWVNGFNSGESFTEPGTVAVTLHKLSVGKEPTTSTGGVTIQLAGIGTAGDSVFIPKGGKSADAGAPAIKLAATPVTATATATGFRLANLTGEGLWTEPTIDAGKKMTVTVANKDTTTPTTATVGGDSGMNDNVTITANFVEQYFATVSVDGGDTKGTATFTDKTGAGSEILTGDKTARVDNGGYVKAEFTPTTGNSLSKWVYEGGELYADANKTTAIDNDDASKVTTVYFFPSETGATLTAHTEQAKYPVSVAVKLDNGTYAGRKVELKQDDTLQYTLDEVMTADATPVGTGVYANAEVYAGTYDIFVDDVETGKTLSFTPEDAEDEGEGADPTKLTSEKNVVRYYTIDLTTATTGTANANNKVAFGDSAPGTSATNTATQIVLATTAGGPVKVAATASYSSGGDHYRFVSWAVTHPTGGTVTNNALATYTLPKEADLMKTETGIDKDHHITLTASFQQYYVVTVTNGSNAPDTLYTPKVKLSTNDTAWTAVSAKRVDVNVGDSVKVNFASIDNTGTRYFKDWSRAAETGDFNITGDPPKGEEGGYNKPTADNTFTPTADSTLALNLWLDGSLGGGNWTYVRGNVGANDNKAPRTVTWTNNDVDTATIVVSVEKKNADNTWSAADPAITTNDYTVSGDGKTYTLKDSYLNTLSQGAYQVKFTYTVGKDHTNVYPNLTKTAIFGIEAKKYPLTQVNIKVENGANTASADDENRDTVTYLDHTPDPEIKKDELTYVWYYADVAADLVTDRTKAPTAAQIAKWHTLTETGDTASVTTAMQGKYIFAVVSAASETAEGTVVTNPISVDYDATITLQKDTKVDNITPANYKVYLVPNDVETPDFTETNLATQGIKKATHVNETDGNGVFSTKQSDLDATESYYVYVNDVEDANADNHHYVKADNTVISRTDMTKTVDYFSVNQVEFTKEHFEADSVSSGTDKSVGEAFPDPITIKTVTTGNGSTVANTMGVLKTTTVKAVSNTWDQDYNLTWQAKTDNSVTGNTVTFVKGTGAGKDDKLADQSSDDASSTADGKGYPFGAVSAKTFIGGRLEQNHYIIKGNVKNLSGETGGKIDSATLTFQAAADGSVKYTFNGTPDANNGAVNGVFTFDVPKSSVDAGAITGDYVLEGTPADGTTRKGYAVPGGTAATTTDDTATLEQVTANHNTKFTIFVAATTLTLKVADGHTNHGAQSSLTNGTSIPSPAPGNSKHEDTVVFNNYKGTDAAHKQTITISNEGNTPLNVALKVEKQLKSATDKSVWTPVFNAGEGSTGTLTGTTLTDGKFTFTNVKTSYDDMAAKTATATASQGIGTSFLNTLTVAESVSYRFTFTSTDARNDNTGPILTFDLIVEVQPVHVGRVTAKEDKTNGTFSVDKNWIKEDVKTDIDTIVPEDYTADKAEQGNWGELKKPQDNKDHTPDADNDIIYTWYVADWDAEVTLADDGTVTATKGSINPGAGTTSDDTLTYTPKANERGLALYLVAKGRPGSNATGAAMTPSRVFNEEPIPVPFAGFVRVHKDGGATETGETELGKYTFKLLDITEAGTDVDTLPAEGVIATTVEEDPDNAGKYIHQTKDTDLLPGHTYRVWASAMEGDSTNMIKTDQTITVGDRYADVDFYLVNVADTVVSQGKYEGVVGTAENDASDYFYKSGTGTGSQSAPVATGNHTGTTPVTNKYVLKGTQVTFTFTKWEKDYDLTWGGSLSGTSKNTADAKKTLTYDGVKAPVTTTQSLNLYPVKANVLGTAGYVNWITMALTDNGTSYTFTTKSGDGNTLGVASAFTKIALDETATFLLPIATGYTTTADVPDQATSGVERWGYSYKGANTDGPGSITVDVTGVEADDTYDINLIGAGLNLKLTETALPTAKTDSGTATSRTGSIPNSDAAEVSNAKLSRTVHLNYNYPEGQTVTFQLENTTDGLSLYRVSRGADVINPAGCVSASDFATLATMASHATADVTLTIKGGLNAGNYTYSTVFTFYKAETGDRHATVTYELTVIVDPLPIDSLTIEKDASGYLKLTDYNETTKTGGVWIDGDNNATTAAVPMDDVNFQDDDVKYVWAKAPVSVDVTKDSFTLTTGETNSVAPTTDAATAGVAVITSATNTTYTPTEQGVNYYLIAYSAGNASNAADFAVSPAFKTTYKGIVYISEDTVRITTTTDDADPDYTVKFVPSDSGAATVDGVWSQVEAGKWAYVGDLDPAVDHYTAKVSRFRGDDAEATLVAQSKDLKGNDIGTETTNSNVIEAVYYSINAKPLSAAPYKTGTGEPFVHGAGTSTTETDIAPYFTLSGTTTKVPDQTPVLKDQNVTALISETAEGSRIGWEQDYTLTWQANATGTFTATDDRTPAKVAADNAVKAAGAYTQGVTAKTYIGGRLDQKFYTVNGNITKDAGDADGSVKKVELKFKPTEEGDTRDFLLTTDSTDSTAGHIHDNNSIANSNNNTVTGDVGDAITFTVVKGVYDITAYENTGTTIQKVTIGGGDDPDVTTESGKGPTRNTNTLTPAVEKDDREFSVYVAGTAMALKVADDQEGDAQVTATSESPVGGNKDNQHDTNTVVKWFNANEGTYVLDVTNTADSNTALTVKAQVFRFDKAADVPNYGTADSWKTGGTDLNTGSTYKDNASGTVIQIASALDAAGTSLDVGATKAAAGTITLTETAPNTADAIYVVRFTSTYENTEGKKDLTGPTVYYVFDLTVEPLPIKEVAIDTYAPKTDGTVSLKDHVADGDATTELPKNSGLDSVKVDTDGSAATTNVGAATAGLVEADILYIWYTAPVTMDEATVQSSFEWNAGKSLPVPKADATGIVVGKATSNDGKTYKATAAEEGHNLYLVAYRAGETCNATDFAVSNAFYAQVTVGMETRRTGDNSLLDVANMKVIGHLDGVTPDPTSNDGTFAVAEANTDLGFTANMTNDTSDPHDPSKADYYFIEWKVLPDGKTAYDDTVDTGITVDEADRLAMTYAVTQKAKVVGYYDKLPELTVPTTYSTDTAIGDQKDDRTFHYVPNDGSGELEKIVISGSYEDEDNVTQTVEIELNALAFEGEGYEKPAAGFGAEGDYVIPASLITGQMPEGDYTVTFYDKKKGETNTTIGYAGYDRSKPYKVVGGQKRVFAQSENMNKTGSGDPVFYGEVKITNGAETNNSAGPGTTNVWLDTYKGFVTLTALPYDGYVFTGWTLKEGRGSFTNAAETPTDFTPRALENTVEASFAAGDFTVENKKATVIFGNGDFEAGSDTSVAATGHKAQNMSFTYTIVNTDDKPGWLELNNSTGEFTFAGNAKVDTNVEVKDATKNTYEEAGKVEDEVVLTIQITEDHSGKTKEVTYTIDVEPGKLAVKHADGRNDEVGPDDAIISKSTERGNDYIAANIAAGYPVAVAENNVPKYNETVLKRLFAYVDVHDQADTVIDDVTHAGGTDGAEGAVTDSGVHEKGTWSVKPGKFEGTDEPSTYTFTFRYMPNDADEKWNYTAAVTDMTLTIAKPPVGALFADVIANADDVIPGTWTADEETSDYSAVAKPEDYNGDYETAPEEMDYTEKTFRKNETITYLDKEPTYTVKLKSVDDDIHGVELTVESKGFTVGALPTFADGTFDKNDGVKEISLALAAMEGKIWANDPEDADDIHSVKITLTGYSSAEKMEEGGEPDVTATYELTVKVRPKKISAADVTDLDPAKPGQTPDTTPTVTAKDEDGNAIDKPTEADKHGNTPITPAVEWTDKDGNPVETFEEGGEYTVTVTLTPDPNYVFEDKTVPSEPADPDDAPNYTMDDKGDKDWPEPDGDPALTVTKPEKDVVLEKVERADVINIGANFKGFALSDAGKPVSDYIPTSKDETKYPLKNETYGDGYVWATKEEPDTPLAADTKLENGKTYVLTVKLDPNTTDFDFAPWDELIAKFNTNTLTHEDDLTGKTQGVLDVDADGNYTLRYSFTVPNPGGGGGGVVETCPCKVHYYVGIHGTTTDATIENVSEKNRPSRVPTVTALDGYTFRGWSLTNPATLAKGEQPTLVDPKTVEAKGETMTFYAVIVERSYHKHYVIGYPNGNFGPADDINRASVATIIARAILPDFVEGANYGNPGGYSDVSGHWAESAIAYCSKFGVFNGMPDGTFAPDRPISRQEFALVMARLDGVMEPGEMTFTDIDEAGTWALGGIYTAYKKGWVNGYLDGTFKPLNNIRRDEAVKVFNAYLYRGVDADGLADLYEYDHTGSGDGTDEYMTWPDVPQGHWAYYEIMEAANDHEFTPDFGAAQGYTLPEHWEKCWISEQWRHGTGISGGSTAMVSAGFRVWLH